MPFGTLDLALGTCFGSIILEILKEFQSKIVLRNPSLSSPMLYTGHGSDCPPQPEAEMTSSSCGSLLHFEIVPPTPKQDEEKHVTQFDKQIYNCNPALYYYQKN